MRRITSARKGTAVTPAQGSGAAGVPAATLGGEDFRTLLLGATTWLERNAKAVDALNVFPVPDGDTGTNMLLTMRATVEGARKARTTGAGAVLKSAAQGAVMGARGNSGVILSQIIAGLSRGVGEHETCEGDVLADAIAEGAATAYRAVTRPVEGTILTVARMAGEGAVAAARAGGPEPVTCRFVLERAHQAAREAVERTPEQLPVLRQAGVVDAGGEGYRIILEGMLLALTGEAMPDAPTAPAEAVEAVFPAVSVPASVSAPEGEEWGYCTQFVIQGQGLKLDEMRQELQELAASALVVGDDLVVRVHGHTEDPGQLLSHAVRYGRLGRISIEDMDAQHDAWLRSQVEATEEVASTPGQSGTATATAAPTVPAATSAPATEPVPLATVVVAPGAGLAEVFRSLGAGEVVPGGQTMNPSAGELLEAARRTGARAVILLPNNGNVVSTAEHAIGIAGASGDGAAGQAGGPRVLVVPTRTVPQGIAALLAFDASVGADENVETMQRAAAAVRTVEVTRATRTVSIDGLHIGEGDLIGLLDDKVVAAAGDPLSAAIQALDRASAAKAELITVYRGQASGEAEAGAFVADLRSRYPDAEVELVFGGQPHFDYLISVE